MKNKINTLIIDSGVCIENSDFAYDSFVELYDRDLPEMSNEGIKNGHGTAVYGIIRRSREIADIYVMHIKDIENGISEESLEKILNYVYKYAVHFDVINLSLGISACNNLCTLQNACKRLTDTGTILISAFNNDGTISYPAAFVNVIGVVSGSLCYNVDDFEIFEDDVVNIAAKGRIQRLAWDNPKYVFLSGNSFACAHVTNKVIELLYHDITTKREILSAMQITAKIQHGSHANGQTSSDARETLPYKIEKACLFPFNKEMHNLVRFHDLLTFEIVDIYDTKYSMTLGATTTHIMCEAVLQKKIKNIKDIDWDTFDTLIIGHTDEFSNMTQCNMKSQLISKGIEKGKNIYSFDDLGIQRKLNEDKSKIFIPAVGEERRLPFRYGMLYRISKPVFAVFGTSSGQGKFTLQLSLRELLMKNGYHVGQIGTEPNSLLFGMDYVVPMGYNSMVKIKGNDLICYLNHIIHTMSIKEKDIIILGSQAGSVSFDDGNLSRYNVDLYSFLLGTNPDAIALCINPYDSFQFIHRTISFLESSINTKVIGLVIFPMTIKEGYFSLHNAKVPLSDEAYYELKTKLETAFHLPIFKLGSVFDMEKLFDVIVEYFS